MYNMCKLFTDKHDISIYGMCELLWQHNDVDEVWPAAVPATVYAMEVNLLLLLKTCILCLTMLNNVIYTLRQDGNYLTM